MFGRKYNLVVATNDIDIVLLNSLVAETYMYLKPLLIQLELRDMNASQFLSQKDALAGTTVANNAVPAKWFGLLPL